MSALLIPIGGFINVNIISCKPFYLHNIVYFILAYRHIQLTFLCIFVDIIGTTSCYWVLKILQGNVKKVELRRPFAQESWMHALHALRCGT